MKRMTPEETKKCIDDLLKALKDFVRYLEDADYRKQCDHDAAVATFDSVDWTEAAARQLEDFFRRLGCSSAQRVREHLIITLERLVSDSTANDFNEHWESYKEAVVILNTYKEVE